MMRQTQGSKKLLLQKGRIKDLPAPQLGRTPLEGRTSAKLYR